MAYPYYANYAPQYFPQYPQYTPQNYTSQNYNPNPIANQSGIIWVSGVTEASNYPVAPNNAVALWEKSGKTIFLKSADVTGKPTLKIYDLVERPESAPAVSDKQDSTSDEYAKKSDLAAVVGAVKSIDEIVGAIRSDIDTMKGDMYGIAGKKKTAKKVEAEDE